MLPKAIIQTKRLILRQWCENDLEPFAQINSDPQVREFFPTLLSKQESDDSVKRYSEHIQKHGWGFWAVSLIDNDQFIGMIGLQTVSFNAPFNEKPTVEIGWRLARAYWGKGYAVEGALASLKYGFKTIQLEEILSFTTVKNLRSRSVMQRIGMHHSPQEDFDHPLILKGHPLRKHVLYRLTKQDWKAQQEVMS